MSDSLWPHELYSLWNSPGQNTGVGSLSLPQSIFPTEESNPGLLSCRWILYQLSHKGSPRILEWVAYPFSSGTGGLLHCRRVPYQLSYGKPKFLSSDFISFGNEKCGHRLRVMSWRLDQRFEGSGEWERQGNRAWRSSIKDQWRSSIKDQVSHGSVVKNPPANARDTCSIPNWERFHMPQNN